MSLGDTEEKILADLHNIVRRAIALGRRLEKDEVRSRVFDAIAGNEKDSLDSLRSSGIQIGKAVEPKRERKQYPYGHVKNTVATALYRHQRGLTRAELQTVCATDFDTEVSDNGALTALKSLGKHGMAKFRESAKKWVPTSKLIEDFDKQLEKKTAPAPEAQGRLVA